MIVQEHKSDTYKYPPRTYHNAGAAHLTVAFAEDFGTLGEKLTHKAAGKKYIALDLDMEPIAAARKLFAECRKRNVKVLNVAGNGIYTLDDYGWTQANLNLWVYRVLELVARHWPLEQIVSGGQTGVDFAGGVAGELLNLQPVMTFPKDYLQRTLTSKHHTQSQADVLWEVGKQLNELKTMIESGVDVYRGVAKRKPVRAVLESDSPSP